MRTRVNVFRSLRAVGFGVALLVACGTPTNNQLSGIGGPCVRYYNCDNNDASSHPGECAQGEPGGYCTQACTATSDCPGGSVCVATSLRVDPRVLVGACCTDIECQIYSSHAGDACSGGTCQHVTARTTSYGTCSATMACTTGTCVDTDGDGAGDTCQASCAMDSDCPAGDGCIDTDGDCTADTCEHRTRTATAQACSTDRDCQVDPTRGQLSCSGSGRCVNDLTMNCRQSCTQDSECRTALGYTCVAGAGGVRYCDQPPECTVPADCAPNYCDMVRDCQMGSCVTTTARDCSDGVDCTDDSCDATAMACTHSANDANCPGQMCDATLGCVPIPCANDAACDDMVRCTLDFCDATGSCQHLPIDAICQDANPCTADSCNPADPAAGTDGCVRTNAAMGTSCEGVYFCRDGETCDAAGNCDVASGTPHCDDADSCTADACDATAMACYHSETCAVLSEVSVTNETAGMEEAAIEFTNTGAGLRDLSGYRIQAAGQTFTMPTGPASRIATGGILVVRWNAPTAGCPATDVCTGVFAPASVVTRTMGDVALFDAGGALDATTIRDYVEWGLAGQPNEASAATASEWTAGTFVNASAWATTAQSAAWTGAIGGMTNDNVANWCIQNETIGLPNGLAAMCL